MRISGKTLMASADPSIHPLVAAFDIEGGSTTCRAIERFAAKKRCVSPGGSDCRSGLCADPGAAWIFARAHEGMLTPLFDLMTAVDTPNNLVPSLHVTFAALILLGCAERASRPLAWIYRLWLAVMSASTLFVHQHHLLDVATGLGLAAAVRRVFPLDEAPARNGI